MGGDEEGSKMILDDRQYPLTDAEIKMAPNQAGVCMLWCGESMIAVSVENSLVNTLLRSREKFPKTTHFSINTQYQDYAGMKQLADRKAVEWNLDKNPIGVAR